MNSAPVSSNNIVREVFHTIPLLSKPLKLDSVLVYLLCPDVEFKSIIITCVCKKIHSSMELTALPREMQSIHALAGIMGLAVCLV